MFSKGYYMRTGKDRVRVDAVNTPVQLSDIPLSLIHILGLPTLSGYGPIRFIKSVSDTIVTAASTCSSAATIPTNLRVATDKLNIPKPIANFCIPLGAQINQDGAAILLSLIHISNHLSELLVTYMYYMTFQSTKYGYGMSIAIVTFLLTAVFAVIYIGVTRERIGEE